MSESMQKPCRPLIPLALAAGVWLMPLYVCAADADTSLKRPEITSRKMYIPDAYRSHEAYHAPIDVSRDEAAHARAETIRPNKSRTSKTSNTGSTQRDDSQFSAPLDVSSSQPYSAEKSAQWRARYAEQVRQKIAQKLAGHSVQPSKASSPVRALPAASQDISHIQPTLRSEEPTHPEAPQHASTQPTIQTTTPSEADAELTHVLSQVKQVATTPQVTSAPPPSTPPSVAGVSEGLLAPAAGQSPQSPTPLAAMSVPEQAMTLVPPAPPAKQTSTQHTEKVQNSVIIPPSAQPLSQASPTPLMNSPFASQISTPSSTQPASPSPTAPPPVSTASTTEDTANKAIALTPAPTAEAPLNPELADLSLASRGILESLPSDLTGLKQRKDPWKDVTIARQNPDIKIPDAKDKQAGKTSTKNNSRSSYDANYELERAYQSLIAGDTESAVGIYQNIISNEPNNETALFGLATTWQRLGNLDKAAPLYGQLLMQNPHNVEVLNNFLALVAEESPQVALQQMERLAQRNPEFSPIFAQLALLHKRLNNFPKAIENMGKAIAVSPENLAYKYNLAILYDQADDKDNAIRVYRQLVRAHNMGQELPASIKSIQERLTFLASNTK